MAAPQAEKTFGVVLPAPLPAPATGTSSADAALAKLMQGAPHTFNAATGKAAEKAGTPALLKLLSADALTAGVAVWLDDAKQKALPSVDRRAYSKRYQEATTGLVKRLEYLKWLMAVLAKSAPGRARLIEVAGGSWTGDVRDIAARAVLEAEPDAKTLTALADAADPVKWPAKNPDDYKVYSAGARALFTANPKVAFERYAPLLRKKGKQEDTRRAMAILYGFPTDGETALDPRFVEVMVGLLGHEEHGHNAVWALAALPPNPIVIGPILALMGKDPNKLPGLFKDELGLLARVADADPRIYDYLVGGLERTWMNFPVVFAGLEKAGRPEGVNVIRAWLAKNADRPNSERMVLGKKVIAALEKRGPVPALAPVAAPKEKAAPAPVTRLEFKDGTSAKFWEISLDGKTVTTRWGRIGSTGQSKVEKLANPSGAQTSRDKQLEEKLKKGYQRTGAAPAAAGETKIDAKLELKVQQSPEDESAYLVLADALSEAADPRGELIAVQHALSKKPKDKKLLAREAALLTGLKLPEADLVTFGWRWGFVERVYLHHTRDWMNAEFDSVGLARQVFALPVCSKVEELQLGVLRWEFQEDDAPAVLKEAAKQGWASRLKRLRIGHLPDEDIDLAHHPVGNLSAISKAFPGLESLYVHSGEFTLAPLALPKLRELTIETCGLTRKTLAAVSKSTLPALEKLVLWFGSSNYYGDAGVKDLQQILSGKGLGRVKHLGLMNAEFTDGLCEVLATSKILEQLEVLDLSMGTMTNLGAFELAKNAGAFKHLRSLNLDSNFLEDEGKKALEALKCPTGWKDQKLAQDDSRYVTVGE
ncbi:MAG: hypothetical protein H6Q89_3517 [Myxococcaceae bacterium]|nr:hypothetical protein [Myxococcaceae bacterium]